MNRPNDNNQELHAEKEEHVDDDDMDQDVDTDTDPEEEDSDDDSEDDDHDDDRDNSDTVPTPEEVVVEYTYPQDFEGSSHWSDVVPPLQFFRLILDPLCAEIAAEKFKGCARLIEIVVPKNSVLTHIRLTAFYGCINLQRITNGLPETLLMIEDYAFNICKALHGRLVVPPNVTFLGRRCFCECSALISVVFQHSITSATVGTQNTSVELGESCFEECVVLRSVRLPPNLLAIPAWCFGLCRALADIFIPKLVRAIRWAAFYKCSNLRSMDLSKNNNLEAVGDEVFGYCHSLTSIVIRSLSSNIQFGNNVFDGCSLLSSIQVYPWHFTKIFEAMNGDPTFIYKFFHQYHHQILEGEEAALGMVTRQHPNGRRRRIQRHPQKRQRLQG